MTRPLLILAVLSSLLGVSACTEKAAPPAQVSSVTDAEPAEQLKSISESELGEKLNVTAFKCDDKILQVGFFENGVTVQDGQTHYALPQVISGSGARYEGDTDDGTVLFWNKGRQAMYQVDYGKDYGCSEIDPEQDLPIMERLRDREWLVEDINGSGVIDDFHATLIFDGQKVSGSAGCNSYNGIFTLAPDNSIEFGPMMTTRKACAPAVMDLERKFLAVLAGQVAVSIDGAGALKLESAAGSLSAR